MGNLRSVFCSELIQQNTACNSCKRGPASQMCSVRVLWICQEESDLTCKVPVGITVTQGATELGTNPFCYIFSNRSGGGHFCFNSLGLLCVLTNQRVLNFTWTARSHSPTPQFTENLQLAQDHTTNQEKKKKKRGTRSQGFCITVALSLHIMYFVSKLGTPGFMRIPIGCALDSCTLSPSFLNICCQNRVYK